MAISTHVKKYDIGPSPNSPAMCTATSLNTTTAFSFGWRRGRGKVEFKTKLDAYSEARVRVFGHEVFEGVWKSYGHG